MNTINLKRMSKWFLLCTTMLISVIPVSCSNNDEPTPPAPSGETFSMKGIADKGWKNIGFIVTDTDDSVTWERVRGQMSSSVFNEWALAHRYIEDNNDGSFSVTTYMNTDIMDFKDRNWKFTNTSVSSPDNERAFTSMGTDVSLSEMRGDTLMTTQALPGYSASQKVSALYVPMTDAELQEIRAEYASAHIFNNKVEG